MSKKENIVSTCRDVMTDATNEDIFIVVKSALGILHERRQQALKATSLIDEDIKGVRSLLGDVQNGQETLEEKPEKPLRKTRGGRKGNLKDLVLEVLQKASSEGMNKKQIAQAVQDAGFQTSSPDLDKFTNSVYQSGIYPLLNDGMIEHFSVPDDRAGRYRVVKK